MGENSVITAVLQMDDLESLNLAVKYLQDKGIRAETGTFKELPKSDRKSWMTPKSGAFVLYVEEDKHRQAMEILGKFFGYSG